MNHLLSGTLAVATALAAASLAAAPAAAQDSSSYTPTTRVWYVSDIDVEDGQFENYMAWLATEWKKFRTIAQKEGVETGYHVLLNTAPRNGEPDLFLVTINKDFMKVAESEAYEKKVNAAMAKDRKAFETESAARAPMRKVMGSIELLELKLK